MSLIFTIFVKLDLDPDSFYPLDPDPHSEKLLDPDPLKMNADPQPYFKPARVQRWSPEPPRS